MSNTRLSQLPARSLIIKTETQRTHMDGQLPEVDRLYLQIKGTPDSFRWMAALLFEKANSCPSSAIIDPVESPQVVTAEWSALELSCYPHSSPHLV
jgi:hypothetical protein